jgi:hypothetical protein
MDMEESAFTITGYSLQDLKLGEDHFPFGYGTSYNFGVSGPAGGASVLKWKGIFSSL